MTVEIRRGVIFYAAIVENIETGGRHRSPWCTNRRFVEEYLENVKSYWRPRFILRAWRKPDGPKEYLR